MTRWLGRFVVVSTVLGTVLPVAVSATPVAAWTNGPCTTPGGVTVVVDFQDLGGGVHQRCAPQPVSSGLDALQQAGIDHQTTVRFPGFVCRIGGQPLNTPCQTASPANAYWSYWVASRGGQWCYSDVGAGHRTPPPGSVEGWSFSLQRTASAPTPRAAVPGPLPGAERQPLPGDCAPVTQQPSAPAPGHASPPPRAGGLPRPDSASPGAGATHDAGASRGHVGPPEAAPSPDPGATQGDEPPTGRSPATVDTADDAAAAVDHADESPAVTGAAGSDDSPGPAEDGASASGPIDTSTSTTSAHGRDAGSTEDAAVTFPVANGDEVAAFDLSGESRDHGSPLGVIVALALIATLTAATLLRRHRERADGV